MAARKSKRAVKRRSSTVKTKLTSVIKSLQGIVKHVDGEPAPKRRAKRGPAKTKKTTLSSLSSIYGLDFDEEPMTLDSPTRRRPARETLRSPGMTLRPPATARY